MGHNKVYDNAHRLNLKQEPNWTLSGGLNSLNLDTGMVRRAIRAERAIFGEPG